MSPALCAPGDGTAGAGLCGWAAWSAEGVVPAPTAWAVRKAGAQRGQAWTGLRRPRRAWRAPLSLDP